MKSNIALIGMAGCGKSLIGEMLARELQLSFVDLDDLLERQSFMSLNNLINRVGDDGFLGLEELSLFKFLSWDPQGFVIATSGSVVLIEKGTQALREKSSIIFLDASFELIEERFRTGKTRGSVIGLKNKSLKEIYDQRFPLYMACADLRMEVGNLRAEEIVERICCWWWPVNHKQMRPRGICPDSL